MQCRTVISPVAHAAASTASVQCQDTDQPCAAAADWTMTDCVLLQLTGHHRLNQNNEMLRHLIDMRNPYIDPANVLQVEILKRLRNDPDNQGLRDALLVTINGIASGMRNTG